MSFVRFVDVGTSASGKTRRWEVYTNPGELILGRVMWHPAWRKYAFHPTSNTLFEEQCLRDLATFIEAQTIKHKLKIA